MKKIAKQIVYLFFALVLVTMYSCDKNDDDGGSSDGDRLTFTKENNADATISIK